MQPFPDFNVIRTIDADLERLRRGFAFGHETQTTVEHRRSTRSSFLSRVFRRPTWLQQPEASSACGD